ncbi:MAG: M18 family aminopeptidase [Myxococcales bacterium]|nr:M18 family aminopeptidase [Myxococcales bacterium]
MPDTATADLLNYIEASPSPFHCVEETARQLLAAGFIEVDEGAAPIEVTPGQKAFLRRSGSLLAYRAGTAAPAAAGFRILGAHTDSPNLRIKPRPDLKKSGYRQWGVEIYGGVLLATWMDRDLGISGRVYVRGAGGKPEARLFRCDKPIARISNVAIHLNRDVNSKGMVLDKQKHLPPMVGLEDVATFSEWLSSEMDGAEIISWDLGLMGLQRSTVGGIDESFIFAPRLDNQASCFVSLAALLQAGGAECTQVIALFDHEEVGSRSHSGAMSAFLKDALARIERNYQGEAPGGMERAIPNSRLISLDMAHAVHPNYSDKHEPNHAPVLNGGPVIKEHVEQRYATDGETTAWFRDLCASQDVPFQDFVIKTNLACGSTIGPISAGELGIRTIDVGNPMLSMHSIREQGGAKDTAYLFKVLKHALEGN